MPAIPSLPPVSREVLLAIGAVVALLLLWAWVRYGRRRYLVLQKSSVTDSVGYELGRIADALERLASLLQPQPQQQQPQPPAEDRTPRRVNWMSMFGR